MKASRRPNATAGTRNQQARDKVQRYYELGKLAIERSQTSSGSYAPGVIATLAEESGESQSTIQKCREFAEKYSDAGFKKLCGLRTPDGKPIGWGHVTKLLTVADRSERDRLQRLTAEKGWTVVRLQQEIDRRKGRARHPGGRKWKAPANKQELRTQIKKRSRQWISWYEQLKASDVVELDGLQKEVLDLLEKANRAVLNLDSALK